MVRHLLLLVSCFPAAFAAPTPDDAPLPATGENGGLGGLFGMSANIDLDGGFNPFAMFKQGPKAEAGAIDNSGGSGPYKAQFTTDPSLPGHTIYAPIDPPKDVKLPVIVFGEGGCLGLGRMYQNFHTEIASHGFLVIANGEPIGLSFTKASDLTKAIDWAEQGAAGGKYGTPDMTKVTAMGQSCGGLEAYSASYREPRVKLTVLLNSGLLDRTKTYLLKELKAPVAINLGGPTDIACKNGERDYTNFPSDFPVLKANLDAGHVGTFWAAQGGQFGKMVLALLKAQFFNDAASKDLLTNKDSALAKAGWDIVSKNWT